MAISPTAKTAEAVRKRIGVRGVVQGVGFRPFVYKLARSLELTGFVFNSTAGVTIEIEGRQDAIDGFLDRLRADPPPLAEIKDVAVSTIDAAGDAVFLILESRNETGEFALISPDVGTCDACWRDFGDPANRRFGYPFTNCTHCGPRYSITQDVPYDRATTTMARFTMCAECRREYEDPEDRRFHAQPNACSMCGPSLALLPRGAPPEGCVFSDKDSLTMIAETRRHLRDGKIVAVKGLGGFLLACDAGNEAAVAELRRRKQRPAKPFALMAMDVELVRLLCELSKEDEAALKHPRRPIVVMTRRASSESTGPIAPSVAPGNNTLGVMLPYTPLHYLLFSDGPNAASEFPALVMTSGNLSEEPIVVSNVDAMQRLDGVADWFLLHNRDIWMRVDDSIVRSFEGAPRVLRRARGFVPQAIDLGNDMAEVLAFGAELKNTFCLTKGRFAFLSQHIGDLETYETMQFFEETLERMRHVFKVAPRVAAHDLHPGYMSTRMARESGIERVVGVQHHHAHIASCMAENRLRGPVIGVAMDGTGYGTDGTIWGGEFLVADLETFDRRGHLRCVPMAGGDAAVRQPWRMALSYLRDTFGARIPDGLACICDVPQMQLRVVEAMLSKRLQTVDTSSCGRLFDAVAALVGAGSEVTFEGQAAIALETIASPGVEDRYAFEISGDEPLLLDMRPAIEGIVADLQAGRTASGISARFHNTLSAGIVEVCVRVRKTEAHNRVCLSGGTFQNAMLLSGTVHGLRREGFEVFLHRLVPANDGGISLGQAVIASTLASK